MYKILLLIILFCSGCDENNSNNKPYSYPLNVYSSYYKFSDENVFITDEGCHGLPGFYTLPLDIRITVGNDVFEKTVRHEDNFKKFEINSSLDVIFSFGSSGKIKFESENEDVEMGIEIESKIAGSYYSEVKNYHFKPGWISETKPLIYLEE